MIDEIVSKKYKMRATFAWWVKWYLHGLTFFCWVMQTEPDYEKAVNFMFRGAKFETIEE